MSSNTALQRGFGGFQLGELNMALPIECIREVVPLTQLHQLPCNNICILGGLDLRGVSIPVVDLRLHLQFTPQAPKSSACVVVVTHEQKLLGLVADRLRGLFFASEEDIHPVSTASRLRSVFGGSLRNVSQNTLCNLLDLDAIQQIEDLPMVADPIQNVTRSILPSDELTPTMPLDEGFQAPLMLMSSKGVGFAVDTLGVQTTLASPTLEAQDMAGDYFLGTLRLRGRIIPAIDLCRLAALSTEVDQRPTQAFLIQTPAGPVAYMVDKIAEMAQITPDGMGELPNLGLPHPELFAGVLPRADLSSTIQNKFEHIGGHLWVLNTHTLANLPEILALAKTFESQSRQLSTDPTLTAVARAGANGQANTNRWQGDVKLITYLLNGECGTRIDQIGEVVSFRPERFPAQEHQSLLGVMTLRGKTIPVYCLSRVIWGRPANLDKQSSIVVVEHQGQPHGFAVPRLRSIEMARSLPPVPVLSLSERMLHLTKQETRLTAEIKQGQETRMINLIDLQAVVQHLQSNRSPLAA